MLADLASELADRAGEHRIEPSLTRIVRLCDLLGDPQRSFPVIQVTGTNGKTSTSRMIESLLRAFGLRTGLFTSPHLVDPRERIALDGRPVSPSRLLDTWQDIAPYVAVVDAESLSAGGIRLSTFEVYVALAFATFADAPIDVGVIEVGMGGTWDATNVADAQVSVVMPIGLDHAEYLGDTPARIAAEKAGIIKAGSIAVLARQDLDVAQVLLERCAQVDATPAREGVEFELTHRAPAVGGQVLSIRGLAGTEIDDVFLPLFGEHQGHNAAAALAATEAFLGGGSGALDPVAIRAGFSTVSSPGRLEVAAQHPTVILDAAHNPHGAHALARALTEGFLFDRIIAVVGVLADKDARGILQALESVVDEVIVTSVSSPRALPSAELAQLAAEIFGAARVSVVELPELAVDAARERALDAPGTAVLITGSVVLVGQAKTRLEVTAA